jgi:AI-2 transport protein TqsA
VSAARRKKPPAELVTIRQLRGAMPRALALVVGLAAVVVSLAGLRQVAWLIGPAFLALVIVITVSPVQGWLRRKGWPRWLTATAMVVVVYAIMIALGGVLVIAVAELAQLLPQYADKAQAAVKNVLNLLSRAGIQPPQLNNLSSSVDLSKLAGVVESLLSGLGGLLSTLVLLLALLLFVAAETSWAPDRLAAIEADRPWIAGALRRFAGSTRSYMVVTTVFGLIVAVLDTIALAALGVPAPVLWGLLAFVTNYIPNIGFIIGVVPPALIALLDGGWVRAVIVIAVYCVLNFVVQSLIQPRFVGDSVGLSTIVTVLSLVFWSWLLGPLGTILAVPATLLVKTLFVDIDPGAGWADALIRAPRDDRADAKDKTKDKTEDEANAAGGREVPPRSSDAGDAEPDAAPAP